MSRLKMTLACGAYDRTRPILDGEIQPEGIELNCLPLLPGETFWRMLNNTEFDASEMSLSSYTILRSKGDDRFVAIPVFLSRIFRHSCLYVRDGSEIREPADLKGKRIGVGDYQMTMAVWIRGFLQDDFGLSPNDMSWVVGKPIQDLEADLDIAIEYLGAGESLEQMLEEGELDALMSVVVPEAVVSGRGRVRRLFDDPRPVEEDYYRRTGIFPIMHTLVIQRDLLEDNAWIAISLYKAFAQAKELACRRLYDTNALPISLPWLVAELERTHRIFGGDYWDYSVEGSRPTLEALVRHLDEQSLTRRRMKAEELFAPQVQDDLISYLRSTGEA